MALEKLLKFIDDAAAFRVSKDTLKGIKAAEGGADAISQLEKNFVIHTLDDGTLFAEPRATQLAIEKLRAEIGTLTEEVETHSNYASKLLNAEVPGGDSPVTHMLNTSGVISGVTLPQRMLQESQKLSQTADIINIKLRPNEFDTMMTVSEWGGQRIKNAVYHLFSNPKHAFGQLSKDLVINPTELHLTAAKYGKHGRKIWKNLTGRMGNAERDSLNRVLEVGNDNEEVLRPVFGGLQGEKSGFVEASDAVKEAYYGTRMLMDHMYWLNNGAAVRQARTNGFKLLRGEGDDIAKSVKVKEVRGRHGESYSVFHPTEANTGKFIKWSKEIEKEGFTVIEMINKSGERIKLALSKEHAASYLHNIDDSFDMIGYRPGYVPVIYDDQWAINKLIRMKDGTFRAERIATAPTRVKMNKAVGEFQKTATPGEGEAEIFYLGSRKNDLSTDMAYGSNLHNILDGLSASETEALKKALVEMGLDPEIAAALEGAAQFHSHKRNPFMMKRGVRLKDWTGQRNAETLPADVAIQKYLQASSSYAANAEYVARLERRYLDEFGELLTDPTNFLSPIKRGSMALSSNGRSAHEAAVVRGQIERVAGIASDQDRVMENYALAFFDKIAESRSGKALNIMLDKMSEVWGIGKLVGTPSVAGSIAKVKGFTAVAKLGLMNFSQAIVQGSAALNVIGKNPIIAAAATKDVIQALGPELMKVGRTAEGRRLYQMLDDSGFIAGFDYVELQRTASRQTDKLLGSRSLRKLWDMNLLPYQLGEGGVRALAWFTEMRILNREILDGLSDLKSAELGSAKYLARINEKASITALNMSRVNQPLVSRGIWGVPLQFKQFLVQQGEFLFRPANFRNRREMLGVYGAWIGAFGIQGVPWLFDISIMVEGAAVAAANVAESLGVDLSTPKAAGYIRHEAQTWADSFAKIAADHKAGRLITDTLDKIPGVELKKYDDARAFWNRLAQSGSISALTDGELNLANRASLARVLTEYYGQQSLDDTLLGPGYQTGKTLIASSISNIHDMVQMWRTGEEFTPNYILNAAVRNTRGLPGVQHPLQAAQMYSTGQWREPEGGLLENDPTLADMLLIGAGFSPGKRGERFERLEFTRRQKEAWSKWIQKKTKTIARLVEEGNTKYALAAYDKALAEIMQVNPLLAKEFMMAHANAMMRVNLTEDQREIMYRTQDSNFYDSSYDKFFFGRDSYMGWGDNDETE